MPVESKFRNALLVFIQREYPSVQSIVDVIVNPNDSRDGIALEDYVVTCMVTRINTTTGIPITEEKECMVNIDEFQKYYKKIQTIRWI
jgi:hypothetical protein